MRRRLFSLFSILFIFIFNINCVNAEACDNADIERLEQVAQGISYSYEYMADEFNVQIYEVTFGNLTDELYIRYNDLDYFENDVVIYAESGVRTFDVYAYNCFEEKVGTITLELPKFNEYSLSDECLEIGSDNLSVCDEWYDGELSYDDFMMEVAEYRNDGSTTSELLINFFVNNYLFFLLAFVVLAAIIVAIVLYRRKRNRLD